jgi:hypothetical protein
MYVPHAHDLLRYPSLGRSPARLRGSLAGGTLDNRRQHSAVSSGVQVTQDAGGDQDAPSSVVVKVSWARVARLIEQALAADPGLVERAQLTERGRAAALWTQDRAAQHAANGAAVQVLADLWTLVRPDAPAPTPQAPTPQAPAPAMDALTLFDLDGPAELVRHRPRPTSSTD